MDQSSGIPAATAASKYGYYFKSVWTLVRGWRNPTAIFQLIRGRPAVISLAGGLRFKVRSLMDLWIVKETCLDRDYESFGVEIEDGWTVIDIGGGLGDFAVSIGYRRPNCTILAFEPFAGSYQLLEENIALNGVTNVQPVQAAVAAQTGTMELAETGAAVQHTTQAVVDESVERLRVPAVGLSEALSHYQLERVDFLKIDCEGGEFEILLETPTEVLHKIAHICLEYHDQATTHHHRELVDHLQGLGFEVRTEENPVHGDLGLLYAHNAK
ncbi:MAG: FkbM family methyltransferase [Ardenticatenaceae bacterium]|nr:FkbM family methyltransferase [Ardenticatenaceae bacterium]